ncbi:hypothetical protein [Mycobacterium palustre]|uniref:Uncharacterized protein n=1 Tax=Mycobacterium palustre TaxID=153971 RepID=A0A1X1ZC45_9MYCO|nr:hypothetical protein [Mycobacterium palustre]MCV7102530.1 hypothetical protein [Mycobacterium palustre]ORW20944.1 hypothetical protein AWC19_14365 [Mycobacterium palustre]
MTMAATAYRLVADDDAESFRILAVDAQGNHICGAYRSRRLNDWKVYATKLLIDGTGLTQPHKVHVISREDAVRWLEMLAHYYTRAQAAS